MQTNIPLSTRWLLDAAGEAGRAAITSVYMITCSKTESKGTGFLLGSGLIVTCNHVIQGNQGSDIQAHSPFGRVIAFTKMVVDTDRDLALLTPTEKLQGGLDLGDDDSLAVGTAVSTWGFPLGYNGPAPLLSVGYLSGFMAYRKSQTTNDTLKHLVVNGAFNPGNSGGPLFVSGENHVVGIVVSKHAPISQYHESAIQALAKNETGVVFTAADSAGKKTQFVESQIVAGLLDYFRSLTQVMIGEAISVNELKAFLDSQGIK
jgi:S1-C subfamily serine protease